MKAILSLPFVIAMDQKFMPCQFWVDETRWYDLTSLRKTDSSDELFFSVDGFRDEFIMFTLCDPLKSDNIPQAYRDECSRFSNDDSRYAYLIDNQADHQICSTLSGKANDTNRVYLSEEYKDNYQEALVIEMFGSEDKIILGNTYMSIKVKIYCEPDIEIGLLQWVKSYNGEEVVEMYSKAGCPVFSINPVFKFIPSWLLAIVFLLVGVFTLIKGRAHILKVSLTVNSLFVTITLMLMVYHMFFSRKIEI